MTEPVWITRCFAALMLGISAYAACRLIASRLWRRKVELDADIVHLLMGIAMAGMLSAPLNPLPDRAWEAVFALATAWFAGRAVRTRARSAAYGWRCRLPVPHFIESIAMLYMMLSIGGGMGSSKSMDMPGMDSSAAGERFPAVALLLAVFMLGYVAWLGSQMAELGPSAASTKGGSATRLALAYNRSTPDSRRATAQAPPSCDRGAPRDAMAVSGAIIAPRAAVSYKIAMGITMALMLIVAL